MPLIFDGGPSGIFHYANHIFLKTDWLDGSLDPVHVGVYERDYKGFGEVGEPNFCLWNGTEWYCPFDTPEEALESGKSPWLASDYQDFPWRGLLRNPVDGCLTRSVA